MSLSDQFFSFLKGSVEPKKTASPHGNEKIQPPPSEKTSDTPQLSADTQKNLELLLQEKRIGENKLKLLEKEIAALRVSIEKIETSSQSKREAFEQSFHFLQADAEREMQFLNRKLDEDTQAWKRQIDDRTAWIE